MVNNWTKFYTAVKSLYPELPESLTINFMNGRKFTINEKGRVRTNGSKKESQEEAN